MVAGGRNGLIAARKRQGHTQESLAHMLGIELETVGRWERAAQDPQPRMWPRLAKALAITTTELAEFLQKRCCPSCGTVLAADNTARLCGKCHREQRDQMDVPPVLESEFFDTDKFRAAFNSQHIGKVVKAYRNHPRHLQMFGKALNQETIGRWLGLTQTQVSRVENGKPEQNLQTLRSYAETLHLPQRMLWFDLSEQSRRGFLVTGGVAAIDAALSSPSKVLQALEMVASRDGDTLSSATDCLDELVHYYSEKLPVTPPVEMYNDLLNVRSFADSLLERSSSSTRRRSDLVAATGWLSNLLAVATSYMGDHGSSLIWCLDAERRGHESGNRDIAGWVAFNRATMAYYQGRTSRSIELTSGGQGIAPMGTLAYAKLAAHEMRARAMIGDGERMLEAQQRATTAIAKLPSDVATTGVFSIALMEDPPYTATSLLLLDRFEDAALATDRVIQAAYRTNAGNRNRQSSNYARTLLILGLAKAGIGDVDGAVAAGREALSGDGVVWPTLVLSRKLDQVLIRDHKSVPEVAEYHDLCLSLAVAVGEK